MILTIRNSNALVNEKRKIVNGAVGTLNRLRDEMKIIYICVASSQ
jgi:hypothetical protein